MKHILYGLVLMIVGCMASGCSDDDKFSTSSSDVLTFEFDTISFDTVITTIGSPTKRLKIFNHSDKGIRILTAGLTSGGSSGFRFNIDGHSGPVLEDIEIQKHDSLFVFADVIVPAQDSETPVFIKDELNLTLENGVTQHVVLTAYGQDAIIMHAPVIRTDTELGDVRPYIIYDSLVVARGATLTLSEGTILCFHGRSGMNVHGQLICNGTQEHPVVFRCDRTDHMFSYLPYDRLDAQWGGITLCPESSENLFDHVDIHGGSFGINCPLSVVEGYKFYIQNSVIHNVAHDGLRCRYTLGQVLNSQITNAGGNCVHLDGGSYNFVHTTIGQFYPWDGAHGSALYFSNVSNDTISPLEQANFYNCLITGSSTDEIIGNNLKDTDAAFNALFDGCLINIHLLGTEPDYITQMFSKSKNETGDVRNWKKDSNGAYSDEIIWGRKNFTEINNDIYYYDFGLSEQSNARGIGNSEYVKYCPTDLNGAPRPEINPDAGCYQFIPSETSEK